MSEAVVRRQSLADQVADAVMAMILDQGLGSGDALPSTGDLAERFSVSRTVVREALADLAARGIVERSQGRDTLVASPGSDQIRELLSFRIRSDSIHAEALAEFRLPVEVTTARLAAQRAGADDLAAMEAALARMGEATSDSEFHEGDIAFHLAVCTASGNGIMALVLDAIVGLMREYRQRWFKGHHVRGRTRDVIIAEHRKVYEAIKRGKPDAAAAAMTAHLEASQEDLVAAANTPDAANGRSRQK